MLTENLPASGLLDDASCAIYAAEARSNNPAPIQPFMTACEALFWIGMGVIKTQDDLYGEVDECIEKWGKAPAGPALLEALEGAASDEPYCAIRRVWIDAPVATSKEVLYADKALSPAGPELLERLRERAVESGGHRVSFKEMTAILKAENDERCRTDRQIAWATGELLRRIRAEQIHAWGMPRHRDLQQDQRSIHRIVPLVSL